MKIHVLTEEQIMQIISEAWVSGSHDEATDIKLSPPVDIPDIDELFPLISTMPFKIKEPILCRREGARKILELLNIKTK